MPKKQPTQPTEQEERPKGEAQVVSHRIESLSFWGVKSHPITRRCELCKK